MSIEFVAQEFWDYVSESATPIALKMMEGNFLFVEIADLDFIVAQLDTTSTTSVYVPASTDYATVAEYLTGNLTDFTNDQFSELISTWNATVTGGGGATGATLLAGTYHTLVDGNSYPKEFVGVIDSLILPVDGTTEALSFTASTINWLDTVQLTLVDGTLLDFQVAETAEVDPCYLPSLGGVGSTLFETSTGNVVDQTLPSDWGATIDSPTKITSADPEVVFPTAILYWEMQMQWIRDRMRAIKRYVEHTIGPQSINFNVEDAITDPDIYIHWANSTVHINNVDTANDLGLTDGTIITSALIEANLGSIVVPRTLGPEHYDFEYEQLYMYKSVETIDTWSLDVQGRFSITNPGTYYFEGIDDISGDWSTITGNYASIADLIDACDGVKAGSQVITQSATVVNAWLRYMAVDAVANSNMKVTRTVSANLRTDYALNRTTTELAPCQYSAVAKITFNDHYIWNATDSTWSVDPDYPGVTPITIASCSSLSKRTAFRGFPILSPYGSTSFAGQPVGTLTVDGITLDTPTETIDFPAATFNLQTGTPTPVYPTYQGAFVYDLELKKWGKMKMSFLSLLDFAPVNTQSSQLLPNARYGVAGGILDADGAIYQWDANPSDAYIKYGKFSLFRLGVTTIQEIEAQFGIQSTGTLETETSLDGKTVDLSLSTSYEFEGARVVKAPISKTGVWHNIILRGQFDLTYLQVNAYRSGRR